MNLDKTKLNYQDYKLAASTSGDPNIGHSWLDLPIPIYQLATSGEILAKNPAGSNLFERLNSSDETSNIQNLIHESQREDFSNRFLLSTEERASEVFLGLDGSSYLRFGGNLVTSEGVLVTVEDITKEYLGQQRLEKKLQIQSRRISNQNNLLSLISDGKPIRDTLHKAAKLIEESLSGLKVEIALVDHKAGLIIDAIAPSLAKPLGAVYKDLSHGESPSLKAIRLMTAVMVDDLSKDPIFKDFQTDMESYGLYSCWATPIMDADKETVGVLTVYFEDKRFPIFDEISLVDQVIDLLRIGIEFHLNQGQLTSQSQVLSKNELLLGKITENYPNAFILIIDRDLCIHYASGQEFKNQGVEPSDLLGKGPDDFEHPMKSQVLNYVESTFDGQEGSFELNYESKNYVIRTVPLKSNQAQVDSVLIAITNETARKLMETELREYNESLRKLSESSLTLTGDLDHIFSITMRILVDLLDVRSISLLKVEGNRILIIRSNHYGEVYKPNRELDMVDSCKQVVLEKAAVVVENSESEDELMKYLNAERLYLQPAMDSRHEVSAVIALALKDGVNLSSEHEALIQIIGQRLATEIEKSDVLQEKEDLSRFNSSIIESLNEVTWDFYPKESKIYWYGALEKVFGSGFEDVSNDVQEFIRGVHPSQRSEVMEKLFSKNIPGEKFVVEFQFEKEPEEFVWLIAEGIIHPNTVNEPDRIIGVLKNIHEQKLYEINRMRAVISAKDIERKRIASEIHDSLGQTLSAARLAFDSLIDDLGEQGAHQDRIDSVMGLIRNAIDESRSISHNLMPPALSDFGLIPALEKMVEKLDQSSEIDFEFIHNNIDERFNEEFETNVFRIFQEAVNNIVKHSRASYATLQMIRHPGYVILTIEDDGVGFDSENVNKGLGLNNMSNRVTNLGGNMTIDSVGGMSITIEIMI